LCMREDSACSSSAAHSSLTSARINGPGIAGNFRRFTLHALAATLLALSTALPNLEAAVGAPFSCPSEIDFLSQGEPDTQLYEGTYGAGSVTFATFGAAQDETYNALGYNPLNNYLYAMDLDGSGSGTAGTLFQIDDTGTATSLGVVSGYTPLRNQPADGAFDDSGNYWITGGNGSTIAYEINVTSTPPAVINTLTLSAPWEPDDFSYSAGYMWGLSGTTIYRLDLSSGTVSTFAAPSGVTSGNFGAAWTFTNGALGFSNNGNGDIYKISIANPGGTPTFTLIGAFTGPVAGASNDGAACTGTANVDLEIVKTGPATVAQGGTITWTLTVTNNGPGNSSGFSVMDGVPGGVTNVATTTPGCAVTGNNLLCSEGVLDNGGTFVATLTGTAPSSFGTCFTNTVTVIGNENDPDSANNSSSLQTCPQSRLGLVKTVTSTGPYNAVGQTITYSFVATNTGNVTLTSVGITDTQTAPAGALTSGPTCQYLSGPTGTCSGSTTTLAAGQAATFTGTYTLTQADLNNGSVSDSATASGTPPTGSAVTSTPSTATVTTTSSPALTVTKSVTSTGPYNAVGQTVTYKFVATNTGNVTLTSVGITDTQTAPAGALTSGPTCQSLSSPTGTCSGATTTLLPGQSATFTGTYILTQADLNNGSVIDSATASGTPPTGFLVTSTPSTATVTTNSSGESRTSLSGLITAKSGSQNARVWTITLSNTGPGAANSAQINSLTLTQVAGAACTPVINAFPVSVGNIAPASSGNGAVVINFTGCPNNARFTTTFTFSANAGVVTGSRTLYNQFQ
jgi:uncharacterized repeat protein (TIGR01451 family)